MRKNGTLFKSLAKLIRVCMDVSCDVILYQLLPSLPFPSPPHTHSCLLQVNGHDLTSCSHHEAVQTIKMAASPVVLLVRCRLEPGRPGRKSSLALPQHQQVGGVGGWSGQGYVGKVGGRGRWVGRVGMEQWIGLGIVNSSWKRRVVKEHQLNS